MALQALTDEELMDEAMNGDDPRFEGVRPSQIALDQAIEMKCLYGDELIMCDTVLPATKTGKIELFSQDLETRFGYGIPHFEPVFQDFPFMLITPSSKKRTNATFGGCEASDDIESVEINPMDAQSRNLVHGDKVAVWNTQGRVTLQLVVTDATLKGVLYSPKGAWRNTSETGFTANALIPSGIRTDIENGACYNETFVDIETIN